MSSMRKKIRNLRRDNELKEAKIKSLQGEVDEKDQAITQMAERIKNLESFLMMDQIEEIEESGFYLAQNPAKTTKYTKNGKDISSEATLSPESTHLGASFAKYHNAQKPVETNNEDYFEMIQDKVERRRALRFGSEHKNDTLTDKTKLEEMEFSLL